MENTGNFVKNETTSLSTWKANGVSPWGTDRLEVLKYTGNGDDLTVLIEWIYFR